MMMKEWTVRKDRTNDDEEEWTVEGPPSGMTDIMHEIEKERQERRRSERASERRKGMADAGRRKDRG